MSTESGIADYRSPAGIWEQYKAVTIQELGSDIQKRKYYWRYKAETIPGMIKAEPNAGHKAIGELDKQGKLHYLLTQNIDGLHEKGGVSKERIVNLHGTNLEAICWSCKKVYDIEKTLAKLEECDYDPRCEVEGCDGFLKPNTVSFGQNLNPDHLGIAGKAVAECDLFLALGSSLAVHPAASFVETAYSSQKPVIIINRDPTPYDGLALYKLTNSLAEILPEIMA
ncbi:MAG: NAD-dependent deacetylase [Spirochaetes bacterium]|nr:NAD-dependent deacetylase [Spirochaetota bacterium]